MDRRPRPPMACALLVAVLLGVAGCGSDDDPEPIGRAALQRQLAAPLEARVRLAGDAAGAPVRSRRVLRVSQVLLSSFGEKIGTKSVALLRLQDTALLSYARAQRAGDAGAAAQALGDLKSTRGALLDLLGGVILPASRGPIGAALTRQDQALTAMLRARAASSSLLSGRRREAERAAEGVARALAQAAVDRHPELLGS